MAVSYAVTWEEPDGSPRSGRLELRPDLLRLEGQNGGLPVEHAFRYRDIVGYHVARGTGERLHGRPTLIVDLATGDSVKVTSVAQGGIVSELASRLSVLHRDRPVSERAALVVPLKPGAKPQVEALLAKGPPFDPRTYGLERHEVFLTERGAVFVFEGVPAVLLEQWLADETVWTAAAGWEPLIEGPIRYADQAYAWAAWPRRRRTGACDHELLARRDGFRAELAEELEPAGDRPAHSTGSPPPRLRRRGRRSL